MELVPPGKEEKQKKDKYKLLSSKLRGKNICTVSEVRIRIHGLLNMSLLNHPTQI